MLFDRFTVNHVHIRCFILLLSLCIGCSQPQETHQDMPGSQNNTDLLVWPVEDPGLFKVGFTTWTVTYQPPEWEEERTIKLNLWYPVDEMDLTQDPPYESGKYLDRLPDFDTLLDDGANNTLRRYARPWP